MAGVRNPLIVALLSDNVPLFQELAKDSPGTAMELCLASDNFRCLDAIWRLVPKIDFENFRLPDTTFLAVMKGVLPYKDAEKILGPCNILGFLMDKIDSWSSPIVRFFSLGDDNSKLAAEKLFEEAGEEAQICLARCATFWESGGAELLRLENLKLPALQVLCLAASQKDSWRRFEWRRAEAKSTSKFLKKFDRMFS